MAFIEQNRGGVVFMSSKLIAVPHAFSTRFGGVSEGVFSSLNLGVNRGDAPENVVENYRRFCAAVGMHEDRMVFSHQVHGTAVRVAAPEDIHIPGVPEPYDADGLVTAKRGLALVIFSADCIPVLLYDPVREAVGACHCGWRGTVMDMAGETVRTMCAQFGCEPQNIRAAIGPGIGRCCFETDDDVANAVYAALGADAERFIDGPEKGKYHIDLKNIDREFLIRAGVRAESIDVSDECTFCKSDKYWSHRATGGVRGSQCSAIMLPEREIR